MFLRGRPLVCIDYSGLKEASMIALALQAEAAILEGGTSKFVLSNFGNCFVTPRFVRHMEAATPRINHLIERNALIGLNKPKMMILKGFNLLMGTDYRAFSNEADAVAYLLATEVIPAPLGIF